MECKPLEDETLDIKQAAAYIKLSSKSLYKLVSTGKVPTLSRRGRKILFSKFDLYNWLRGINLEYSNKIS